MLKYICFIILICSLAGCKKELPENMFSLEGKVLNFDSGTAILSYTIKSDKKWMRVKDTVTVGKGKFRISNKLTEPVLADLSIADTILQFFIEPGNMKMEFSKNNPFLFKLTGSKSETEADLLKQETDQAVKEQNRIRAELNLLYKKLDVITVSSPGFKELTEKKDNYSIELDSLIHAVNRIKLGFIRNNTSSFISAYTLNDLIFEGYVDLGLQKLIFESFPSQLKNSTVGKDIFKAIECQENTEIGALAPDFTTPDINGKAVRLSDFKNKKYVLLDFWASWCTPCLMGLPSLKNLYEKYNRKGLEIISISSDSNREDWLESVRKNNMDKWIHVLNVQDLQKSHEGVINNEDIREKYQRARFSIPVYYLIDKEGRIIGKWYGYAKEIEIEMETLLEKILN